MHVMTDRQRENREAGFERDENMGGRDAWEVAEDRTICDAGADFDEHEPIQFRIDYAAMAERAEDAGDYDLADQLHEASCTPSQELLDMMYVS